MCLLHAARFGAQEPYTPGQHWKVVTCSHCFCAVCLVAQLTERQRVLVVACLVASQMAYMWFILKSFVVSIAKIYCTLVAVPFLRLPVFSL